MEIQDIAQQLRQQLAPGAWDQAAGFLSAAVDAIDRAVTADAQGAHDPRLDAAARALADDYVMRADEPLDLRLIAAELLGRFPLVPGTALDDTLAALSAQAGGAFTVGRTLAAGALARHAGAVGGVGEGGVLRPRGGLPMPDALGAPSPQAGRARTYWTRFFADDAGEAWARAQAGVRADAAGGPLPAAALVRVGAPPLATIRTHWGLAPGDVLFRRMTGALNPFRDFGHTGIYVGCLDAAADVGDCRNHQVIQVGPETPACHLSSLHEFCKPGGQAEQFWGGYHVDMTGQERQRLIDAAFGFVGLGSYAFTWNYKNPHALSFRCDGFVEHCHEAVGFATPPMAYRGGLFEGDTWLRLNPVALRSCLTSRVLERVPGC